jgi:hypothetical protein
MKKETLRGLLLLFLCSGFWVLTLMSAASYFGIGFAQGQQPPYNTQGLPPPFGVTPAPPMGMQQMPPSMGVQQISNNAMLPNQTQATYNTATQEVKIPFQVDTSRLMAFSVVVDNSTQTLTVLDPVNQSLAVYHVYLNGPNVGKCELQSVRNISADLKFYDYDSMKPFPGEVQAIIDQQTKQ